MGVPSRQPSYIHHHVQTTHSHQVDGSSPDRAGGRLRSRLPHLSLLLLLSLCGCLLRTEFSVGCKCYLHLMGLLKKPCKDPLAGLESLDLSVTEEQMQGHLSNTLQYINTTVASLRNLLLMENYLNSAKFGLILYLLTFLGSFTNSLTLVTVAWVALFSLPTVYAAKQTEIDSLLDTVHTHYTALNTKLSSLLPAPTQEKTDQVKTQ